MKKIILVAFIHTLCLLAAYADARYTRDITTSGGRELNPVMRLMVKDNRVWYGVKLGGSAYTIFRAERQRRSGNPNWWRVEAGLIAGQGFGAAWDFRQVKVNRLPDERKVWFP